MKPISGKKLARILQRRGWRCIRSSGSHFAHVHDERPGVLVIVPIHKNRDLPPGTQRDIMKATGLTDADL